MMRTHLCRAAASLLLAAAFFSPLQAQPGANGLTAAAPSGTVPSQIACTVGADGKAICGPYLGTSDPNNASYSFGPVMTSGTSYPIASYKQRGILVVCTAAGSENLTDTAGSVVTVPMGVGVQYFPFASIVSWANTSGSSAACTNRLLL